MAATAQVVTSKGIREQRVSVEHSLAQAVLRAGSAVLQSLGQDGPTRSHPEQLLEDAFVRSLRLGDARTSEQVAVLMASRLGTGAVYLAMSRCLAELGSAWAAGRSSVLVERAASEAALAVCERLRGRCPDATVDGRVVLTTPPGDRHTLALRALGHQLQVAGRPVQVLEDVPWPDLCEAVELEGTSALALSVHLPLTVSALRRLLVPLRVAAPQLLIVLGGPGVPAGATAVADLVTQDADELVVALCDHDSVLTAREREVLAAVADGLTTHEIADRLRLSSSTVKTHLDHILSKTGTEHRAAAVARALRSGWLR